MKLIQIKPNLHRLITKGCDIFFSYDTPVMCIDYAGDRVYKNNTFYSRTTTRHIQHIWDNMPTNVHTFDVHSLPEAEFKDILNFI